MRVVLSVGFKIPIAFLIKNLHRDSLFFPINRGPKFERSSFDSVEVEAFYIRRPDKIITCFKNP